MNILFAMTVSGSLVFLLYLFLKPMTNRSHTAHWQYGFLKACILFYLVPYQLFRNGYLTVCNLLFTGKAVNPLWGRMATFKTTDTIFVSGDGHIHFKYWQPLLVILILWLCTITVLLCHQIRKYRFCRRNLLLLAQTPDAEIMNTVSHCHSLVMPEQKRKMQILQCTFADSPFILGLFRPVLILPAQSGDHNLSLYLSHELYHIKNHDIMWKCAAFLTMLVHWYNPLCYLLFLETCTVSEKHCDEQVIAPLDADQQMHYGNLIIEAASNRTHARLLFADTFSTSKKQTEERILFMTRQKHKSTHRKLVTAIVIGLSILSMPISVLAYHPVSMYTAEDYSSNTDAMYVSFSDSADSISLDASLPELSVDFTLSDNILTDACGNQYAITDTPSNAARACSHEYIDGTRTHHAKNGSGCIVYVYKGKYCRKCYACQSESLYSQTTYTTCPH